MKIRDIKDKDLRALAVKRYVEYAHRRKEYPKLTEILDTDLVNAFIWLVSPEGGSFWAHVNDGDYELEEDLHVVYDKGFKAGYEQAIKDYDIDVDKQLKIGKDEEK